MTEIKPAEVTRAEVEDLKRRVRELETAEIQLRRQAIGPRGPVGPPGPQCESIVGPQAKQGARGTDGRDGRDGQTPTKERWSQSWPKFSPSITYWDENALPYTGSYAKK